MYIQPLRPAVAIEQGLCNFTLGKITFSFLGSELSAVLLDQMLSKSKTKYHVEGCGKTIISYTCIDELW